MDNISQMDNKNKGKISRVTKKIISDLCRYLNLKYIQDLADYIEVPVSTVYSWIRNDKITNTGKILAKNPEINIHHLETGEEPMLIVDESNIDQIPPTWPQKSTQPSQGKIKATIEPGNERQRGNIERQKSARSADATDTELPLEKLLAMTKDVLMSDTVYKPALTANVRAFHKAIKTEAEMSIITHEVRALREENHQLNERMARMEEMLISLGAKVEQKRDQANG